MKRQWLILMLILMRTTQAAAGDEVGKIAPNFMLQDQFDRNVSLLQFEGRILVLIASDREGKSQNAAWVKAVQDRYADKVVIQGVADVSGVPFFLKGKVRNDLKKDKDSILLDWKGEVVRAYGLSKGVANIVVIDRKGMIRYRYAGSTEPAVLEEAFRALDKALE